MGEGRQEGQGKSDLQRERHDVTLGKFSAVHKDEPSLDPKQ